jgi:hypothetical protein
MKTLYESILSTTNSGRKAVFKSFNYIKDIDATNPNVKLNKILNIKKMKDYIASNSDIIVFSNDKDARVFSKFLCTIEFTAKEWDILRDGTNQKDVDLLLKNKLKPFIKEKTINDYSFCINEKEIFIVIANGVSQKELIGEYTYETTVVWFRNNFEF